MSVLDSNQQTELEKPVTRVVYFVEFRFRSGTQRICTWNQPIVALGQTWSGFGQIMDIDRVEESEGTEAKSLNFRIMARPEWIAAAIGPVSEYRGQPVKMYMCPLDESFALVGTPALAWSGYMDTANLGIDGDEGSIQIRAETQAYNLSRQPVFRINASQHKARYPNDTGLDYLNDLIANPKLWLSKKFQSI